MAAIASAPLPVLKHETFHSDNDREHDGLEAELAPDFDRGRILEDLIVGEHGRAEEEGMKLLLKGGMI
ncbi:MULTISPECIES: hypothetical protein [Uliginosibacterium]|uniref:Uncharacterized protein n=1 Tax=Uliginosibacterium aquaticum TaxID=2731212 RepID=A0ABX2IH22_9RHOO|nr:MULTISPECIES: hypothetical protein [Uliginosibacterium]MDO6387136.1 hypothetical protein [Uliginosibacterium sp. 31-12]NSL56101.1 hypothetical protein [Uliginosibacterium aquaticum]PLK50841.1 hypothetical protein C0V76_03285 [Uliginosibacterium sp. TH139]